MHETAPMRTDPTTQEFVVLGEWHPARAHATRLREWLEARGYVGGSLVASDLRELYSRMCAELGWHQKPWNVIARSFAVLTVDGRKVYAVIGGRRVRIYPLPRRTEHPSEVLPA